MARSSVALFLVTTGLITTTFGCGHAPEPKENEGGEAGVSTPAPSKPAAGAPTKEAPAGSDRGHGGEGGEGGEG
ncbi:MAG: hypothetical protein ER33_09395 [Cyanobium sp. CACIAM 14]|nr:MAG: hypothetical protein ER33_09395 [Cyanobium sp. CACIAM 14]